MIYRLRVLLVCVTVLDLADAGCLGPTPHCQSILSARAYGKSKGTVSPCKCERGEKDCKSAWICVTSVDGVPIHNGPWPCHLCYEPPKSSGRGRCRSCPGGYEANYFHCNDEDAGTDCNLFFDCCTECMSSEYSNDNNRDKNACKTCPRNSNHPICKAKSDVKTKVQSGGWVYTPICTKGIFAKGRGYTRYNRRTKTDGTKATLDCASGHKLVVPKDGSDIRECKCSGVACKWVTDASNDELPTCFPVCKAGCTKVAGSCMGSGRRLFDQAQEEADTEDGFHFDDRKSEVSAYEAPDFASSEGGHAVVKPENSPTIDTDTTGSRTADVSDIDADFYSPRRNLQWRNVCKNDTKCKEDEVEPVGDRSCDDCQPAGCDSSCDDGTGFFKDKGPNPGCDMSCDERGPCLGSCDNCCSKCPAGESIEKINNVKTCVGCADGQYRAPVTNKCEKCPDCGPHGSCGAVGCVCRAGYSGDRCQIPPACAKDCIQQQCSCFETADADRGTCDAEPPTTPAPKPATNKVDLQTGGIDFSDSTALATFKAVLLKTVGADSGTFTVGSNGTISIVFTYESDEAAKASANMLGGADFKDRVVSELKKADSATFSTATLKSSQVSVVKRKTTGNPVAVIVPSSNGSTGAMYGIVAAVVVVILLLLVGGGAVTAYFVLFKTKIKKDEKTVSTKRKATVVVSATEASSSSSSDEDVEHNHEEETAGDKETDGDTETHGDE